MSLRKHRSIRAVAGLALVVAVLAALAGSLVHQGPHCRAQEDCLACRWSADSVVVPTAPPPLLGLECLGTVHTRAEAATAASPVAPFSSRAPPRG